MKQGNQFIYKNQFGDMRAYIIHFILFENGKAKVVNEHLVKFDVSEIIIL